MENMTNPIIEKLSKAQPMLWINPNLTAAKDALSRLDIIRSDTAEAEARLERFGAVYNAQIPADGSLRRADRIPAYENAGNALAA